MILCVYVCECLHSVYMHVQQENRHIVSIDNYHVTK